jgi:SAM-dependent methyltransferase
MLLHASSIWERWSDLTRIVRETGRAERKEAGLFEDPQELEAFIGAMHVVGSMMADRVAARVDPGSARRLLDVGGGSGTYTIAFLKTSPELTATIFDRPPVVEMARRRLEDEELLGRVELVGGDFYQDEFPPGHDLVWLSAIIHQNSPEQNLDLYRKIHRAMTPGGRLVIRDHVMSEDRTEPESGALFAINMLVGTPGGGTYTFEEIRDGLIAAGFDRVQLLDRSQPMGGLVEAFKS